MGDSRVAGKYSEWWIAKNISHEYNHNIFHISKRMLRAESGSRNMASKLPVVSLEFFPPRSEETAADLRRTLTRLLPYRPVFTTVSYGAGGSTRHGTATWVRRIRRDYHVDCAPHLTHVSHSREEVRAITGEYLADGVRRVIALRGDLPPEGVTGTTRRGGYASTVDLVADLKSAGLREVIVAAHPEHEGGDRSAIRGHVEFLKKKMDAGANLAITQFFLDNSKYYRLRDACASEGIDDRLAPGIMPLHNVRQVIAFAAKTGVEVSQRLHACLAQVEGDPDAVRAAARRFSLDQVRDLARQGVERFHIYTMNRVPLTESICRSLGLTASVTPP